MNLKTVFLQCIMLRLFDIFNLEAFSQQITGSEIM